MPFLPSSRLEQAAAPERDERKDDAPEQFDRVAFVMSALDLVRPRRMTVAVCPSRTRLHVEAGRAWGRGEGARWAMISVPPNASREAIVLALTELVDAGPDGDEHRPYALDVLLSNARAAGRGFGGAD